LRAPSKVHVSCLPKGLHPKGAGHPEGRPPIWGARRVGRVCQRKPKCCSFRPFAPSGRPAQGLDLSRWGAAGRLTRGEAKRAIPMNGAYRQTFGLKKQARARAILHIGAPRWENVRRGRLRIVPGGVRRARSVSVSGAPPPPVPSLPRLVRERAAHSTMFGAFRACQGRLGALTTPCGASTPLAPLFHLGGAGGASDHLARTRFRRRGARQNGGERAAAILLVLQGHNSVRRPVAAGAQLELVPIV
jgi:hypothetical protein